jgi:hypothetical protein
MKCHFNYKAIGVYACEEEGTNCPPCACWICSHTVNLLCEKHQAYVEGFIAAAYMNWELQDPEHYEPEDFDMLYEILGSFVIMSNHLGETGIAATRCFLDGKTEVFTTNPNGSLDPPVPEEDRCPPEYRNIGAKA